LVLDVFVSAANVADVKAAPVVLVPVLDAHRRIQKILADQAYRGPLANALAAAYGCVLEVTHKLGEGFVVAPWRWVVERTFAWLENARRLCRDYEELPEHHEGVIYVVMIRLMLRRLHGNRRQRKLH
jgi:transposase